MGWSEIDYLDRASEIVDVPGLVFHGTNDGRVPIEHSRRLAAEVGTVALIEFAGAGHVTSWNSDPDTYDAELRRFLTEVTQ